MQKNFILAIAFSCSAFAYSQVGINTSAPKSSLDIVGEASNTTKVDGVIAPRLTRLQLTNKGNTLYGTDQIGAIIFITDVSGGDSSSQRVNIDATGYYYFDGSAWQKLVSTATNSDLSNDSFANDNANTMVKLSTNSDGVTSRTAGTEFVVKDTGNVGIGKDDPSVMLDVNGKINAVDEILIKRNVEGGQIALQGQAVLDKIWYLDQVNDTGNPRFRIFNGSNGLNGITILENGNVGIATTIPGTKLHIDATSGGSGTGFRLVDGSQGSGKVLSSDANGNASWATNVSVTPTVLGNLPSSGITMSTLDQKYYTNASITLPSGKWIVSAGTTLSIDPNVIDVDGSLWAHIFICDSSSSYANSPDLMPVGATAGAGGITRGGMFGMAVGQFIVNNTSGANKTYYIWMDSAYKGASDTPRIAGVFSSLIWERWLYASPIN